jgi:hypothetical protein
MIVPANTGFIAGVVSGLTTGISQWLILRRAVTWAGWWIVINFVGWSTGMGFLPGIFLTGVIAGAVTGLALVLLLRYPAQMKA